MKLSTASIPLFISSAISVQGLTLVEQFTGNSLNPWIWDNSPIPQIENSGNFNLTNDRLEFTAAPAASLIGNNHFATYSSIGRVTTNNNWTASVTANLAALANFGAFGSSEIVSLTLGVENTVDSDRDTFEFNFVAGDPFSTGIIKGARAAVRTDDVDGLQNIDVLSDISNADLKLSYNATTGLMEASYNLGGSDVSLGSFDLSGWDVNTAGSLNVSLTGSITSVDSTLSSGAIEVLAGEAFFDDFQITGAVIPEPSTALLGCAGLIGFLRRRR